MTKEELKQYIDDNIYENQDGEITGEALNEVLKAIVDDGGTEVEANPEGEATETLGKIKIGERIYEIPNISNKGLLYGGVIYPETEITPDVNCYYIPASTGYYESFDVTVHDYEKLPYLSYDAANDLWIVEYFDVYTYAYAHGKFEKVTELGESTIQVNSAQEFTNAERLQALANVSNQEAGYESEVFTGKMGYVVLQPQDDTDLENTSFAAQIANKPNTIFEIRDVFDLGGTQETPVSVTLPTGSTLKFEGGKLKNAVVSLNNTIIDADAVAIFDNVSFSTTNGNLKNRYIIPEWFGAIGDGITDCTEGFKKILAISEQTRLPVLIQNNSIYYITNTLIDSGEHRIRIEGQEKQTSNWYSPSSGFIIKNNISLFSNCTISGDIIYATFIGSSRTNPATIFDNCSILRLSINTCLFSQFEAIFRDTTVSACRIVNNRFLTCYSFATIVNSATYRTCTDSIIEKNYINGGAERNDNHCFGFSSYNATIITNNFVDYYRDIFRPSSPNTTACKGIVSIANQYQVFRHFLVNGGGISSIKLFSNCDVFNWTNPSSLAKLQNYTKLTYTDRWGGSHEYPPFIGICDETIDFTCHNAYLQSNVDNNVVFLRKTPTNYSYSKLEFDIVASESSSLNYSIAAGGIYNGGSYKGNCVKMDQITKSYESLPAFAQGWTSVANGSVVVVGGVKYRATNVYNIATNNYESQWILVNVDDEKRRHSGTTTERPTIAVYVGFEYFDTTLGKPIYISNIVDNVITWVDATGTTV